MLQNHCLLVFLSILLKSKMKVFSKKIISINDETEARKIDIVSLYKTAKTIVVM